jgi:cob(I)alamin adenosyltransferase
MRITKVYTKTGDKGKTRLAGGQQVWKDDLRVEAYGTVDELNAVVGVVRTLCTGSEPALLAHELGWIQNKLFDVGGLLATVPGQSFGKMPQITEADTARLERLMDTCQLELLPLREFILPGGGAMGAHLHLARTICRRAERRCVSLMRREVVATSIVVFLNRLSDAFFVLARWVAKHHGEPEVYWQRERGGDQPPRKRR